MLDFASFFIGYFVCMICDVVFSLCSFLISRALFYKTRIKELKQYYDFTVSSDDD